MTCLRGNGGCPDCSRVSYGGLLSSSGGESESLDDTTRKSTSPASSHTSSMAMMCFVGHSGSTLIRAENTLLVSSFNFASRVFKSSRPIISPSMLALPSWSRFNWRSSLWCGVVAIVQSKPGRCRQDLIRSLAMPKAALLHRHADCPI
jgi:hypothetical protein